MLIAMGSGQSSNISRDKFGELVFERGDDSLAVEVHSAEFEEENVTVFTYISDGDHRPVTINTLQTHKVLRHPCILKLITCTDPAGTSHVVTEPATPLCVCLEYVSSWEITVGLSRILEALNFLHSTAGFSHNNISLESIYVTPDGRWKLGRLDCTRKFAVNSADYITLVHPLRDPDIYTDRRSDKKALPAGHCRDIKGFGRVCESLLERLADFDNEMLSNFSDAIDLMVSDDSGEVPTAAELLTQPLLSNSLVTTLKFIEEISIKSPKEKAKFFSTLMADLRELPEIVIAKLLVRPLLKRFVVENEVAYDTVIPILLTPKNLAGCGGLLSPTLYQKYVSPVIYRLFTVREYNVRMLLLRHFHSYCDQLDKNQLEKLIMPLILQGLHDSKDTLVSLSLVALSDLVPVLGGATVIGTERKDIFVDTGVIDSRAGRKASLKHEEPRAVEASAEVAVVSNGRERPKRIPRKPRVRKDSHNKEKVKLGVKVSGGLKLDARRSVDDSNDIATEATELEDLPGSPTGSEAKEMNGTATTSPTISDHESSDSADETADSEMDSPRSPTKSSSTSQSPPLSKVKGQGRRQGSLSLKATSSKITKKKSTIDQDFSKLDIKSSVGKQTLDIDFFADMAPAVGQSKSSSLTMSPNMAQETASLASGSKVKPAMNLAFAMANGGDVKNGWGDDEGGWDNW